eukprot:CFRG7454T1
MKEIINQLQRKMLPGEKVYFAMEVDLLTNLLTSLDKKRRGVVALVANLVGGRQQDAIFVFDWHRGRNPTIRHTIAVLDNFNIIKQGESEDGGSERLGIPSPHGGMVAISARDSSSQLSFNKMIEIAVANAVSNKYCPTNKSHLWLLEYPSKDTVDIKQDTYISDVNDEGMDNPDGSYGPAMSGMESPTADDIIEADWINHTLRGRAPEYSDTQPLKLVCGTWNVCQNLPEAPLDEWLGTPKNRNADIYALGLQEVDMSASALFGTADTVGLWSPFVEKCLLQMGRYVRVRHQQLVGLLIMVYVKADIAQDVRDVADAWVGVGLMNLMGNKGAVAVRFRLHGTTFCFVNCHLAAYQDMVERRNQDHTEILRRLSLPPVAPFLPHERPLYERTTILEYDRLFWLGDMNYRIDLTNEQTRSLVEAKNWSELILHDQLTQNRAYGRVFVGFHESSIAFPPTYKYDFGTDKYDSTEKQRIPAWTDRILWKGEGINCSAYDHHPGVRSSDHKPVSASITVDVNILDLSKLEEVYQNVMRENDRLKNIALPDATIDVNMVEFGDLRYMEPVTRKVKITNVGYVPVRWRFIARQKDSSDCAKTFHDSWLNVTPMGGSLRPGETTEIDIEANVSKVTAARHNLTMMPRNEPHYALEDILILHLERGKDLFIVTSGSYQLSPFGMKLSDLVSADGPVRHERETKKTRKSDGEKPLQVVPNELIRLVEYLLTCSDVPNILLEEGEPSEMASIRESLSTGKPFTPDTMSPHSYANTLLDFCASLEDTIVPQSFTRIAVSAAAASAEMCPAVVETFPTEHYNTMMYIINFALELLKNSDANHLQYETVASVLADVLMDTEDFNVDGMGSKKGRYMFIYNILEDAHKRA